MVFLLTHKALAKKDRKKGKERISFTNQEGVLLVRGIPLKIESMGQIEGHLKAQMEDILQKLLMGNLDQAKNYVRDYHLNEQKPKMTDLLNHYLLKSNRLGFFLSTLYFLFNRKIVIQKK